MLLNSGLKFTKLKKPVGLNCPVSALQGCFFSQDLESKYNVQQKDKILQVINDSDGDALAGYDVTKGRLKKFSQWRTSNGQVKCISEVELIDGFNEKTAVKLFNSILEGPPNKAQKGSNKIKGQILQPTLSESVRQSCKSVVAVYVTVNSVCWTLIDRTNYEVLSWQYHSIDYPDGKRLQITDILDIAWSVTQKLPAADIYVMQGEPTTLRAAGSDPNNPKVIAVNLQKAQMIAMIVALINARRQYESVSDDHETENVEETFKQKVHFLRPTLPFRLYGTLVGNEKVSTEQSVEIILQDSTRKSPTNSHVYIPEALQNMFRSQKDLQKDMLGHSLLLGLTFMDVCVYKNHNSIEKLTKRRD